MNIKRAFIVLLALMFMPSLVMAQLSPAEGTAVVVVQKVFMDGNDVDEATLQMQCLTGNPTQQEVTLTPETKPGYGPYEAAFVLSNIPEGDVGATCTVTEVGVSSDYSATYRCTGDSDTDDSDGGCADDANSNPRDYSVTECLFEDVKAGDINNCFVYNDPNPVVISVTKDWVVAGAESQRVKEETDIMIECDNGAEILGPTDSVTYKWYTKNKKSKGGRFIAKDIEGDATIMVDVVPGYPSSDCEASESVKDSAVELTTNCGSMEISTGTGDSCTMTNTVFFEGIPTLSQYGMAIMALLMLGVGFVGFRRFV